MDLNVEFCDKTHVIEVALADAVEDMRRKVASAVGLPEDSFDMSFGDEAMGEGADMTQLSAGDTIFLTTTKRCEAIAALRALGETDLRPERLMKVRDPEVACLLLQAEVTTVIPEGFLGQTSITRLDLSAVSTVTRVDADFLYNCTKLTSLDLSSFNSLTHIENGFLNSCESLTSLDLSSLNNLTHIGDWFISNCSLTALDLSSLNRITRIGNGFVTGCRSLRSIDVTPLKNVTVIGYSFLLNCTSLTSLDLSSFTHLTRIGDYFLNGCESLTSLDLSSLSNVTDVGSRFCEGTNLHTIRLSGCSAVVSSAVKKANLMKFVVEY